MVAPEPQRLPENEVHVRIHRLDAVELTREASSLLSAEEALRALKMRSVRSADRFLKSRIQLRKTLSAYLGVPPADIRLEKTAAGKPTLCPKQSGGLRFNLSHSGEMAVIALGLNQELGVDVEEERHRPDFEGIVRRFFSEEEKGRFYSTLEPGRASVFYSLWTRKEALAKARGSGLFSKGPWPSIPWRFHTFRPAKGYTVSLCSERGDIRCFSD